MKCLASPSLLYTSLSCWTSGFGESVFIFQGFSSRATFLKLHWAGCGGGGRGQMGVLWWEHEPVNARTSQVKLRLCNDYHSPLTLMMQVVSYHPADKSSLFKDEEKLLLTIYCYKKKKLRRNYLLCCYGCFVFFNSFLDGFFFFPQQKSKRFIFFPNGALCGNACYVLWYVAEFYAWTLLKHQTRNRYPFIKGYVVVYHATPPLRHWDWAESAF